MNNFETVRLRFDDLPYMTHPEAMILRDFIKTHDVRDILEIGFFQGKSSAYFAAILEDLGRGHLVTIDRVTARQHKPNVKDLLSALDLTHRVTSVFAERSYTWEMAKMIQAIPRTQFDFCYFDGGHTWDATGFGFVLVDILLRPGGWIIFDDLKWTIEAAIQNRAKVPKRWRSCSPDERATPAVSLVFDLLVPHFGYTELQTANKGRWGIARKPAGEGSKGPSGPGKLKRILDAVAD